MLDDLFFLGQIGKYGSDFEQYLNTFHFSHELAQIMTTCDFLSATQVILRNVPTNFNLTKFRFWSTFHMNWHI